MVGKLLLSAGFLAGGFILAWIAARFDEEGRETGSDVPERRVTEEGRETGRETGGEVPRRRVTEEGRETGRETGSEVPRRRVTKEGRETGSEVPKPLSTPTNKLPARESFSFVESKKTTLDSGIQHKKCPSSSVLLNPQTAPQKTTHAFPRQTINSSGTHKEVDQLLPTHQLPSSCKPSPSSEPHQPLTKPVLYVAPCDPTNPRAKTSYFSAREDGTSPIYEIPEDLKDLIKKDVVPRVLKRPLSPSTYKDYFDALLYAEDFYIEKWDGFEIKNVTLELQEAAVHKRKAKYNTWNADSEKVDKIFVAFKTDSIPERLPFLLSRDFVFVRPSGKNDDPFQGLIYRVVKSNRVLVEFGEDFHHQHFSACKYDVKFSFNRVCLKRAHQGIAAASDPLFRSFLFPDCIPKSSLVAARFEPRNPKLDRDQVSAVCRILSHQNLPPYLVEGPLSVDQSKQLSRTGLVVCEAVLQIYRTSPSCRILVCAPINSTCDVITRSLKKEIPESDMFRANAAFRELDEVPPDILPTCLHERECFSCPSIQELRKFKVVLSTFVSSFRLQNEGIMAGHFSHIFMVDASSATEPETMVALANLANERTTVTITGAPGNRSGWIRSNIARQNGLMISYFERLRESELYKSLDSRLITVLGDSGGKNL